MEMFKYFELRLHINTKVICYSQCEGTGYSNGTLQMYVVARYT
jgi:hypothetical protein